MANTFSAKNVPAAVQSEIKARSNGLLLTRWSAKRFPWIHVLSCSAACGSKYSPLTSIKGSGPMSFTDAYNIDTKLPYPIVEGLEMKAMGSLGTTRKGTLSIKCYTDEDLIELQKCYFIPGMDVRVQWGWNQGCDGTKPPTLLTNTSLESTEASREINKLRKNNPSYDGFQGIVTNFSYNLGKDNTWNCTVEFISAADPFTDSSINSSEHPCARTVENDEGEATESFGPIYAALRDIYTDYSQGSRVKAETRKASPKRSKPSSYYVTLKEYEGFARTEQGGDDSGWLSGVFGGVETEESYINFQFLLDIVNVTQMPSTSGKQYPYGHITCNNVKLPKPKITLSSDPRVCYLPGQMENEFIDHEKGPNDSAIDCVGGDYVRLDNIMVNTVFLLVKYKAALDGDGKLSTFVMSVLDGINRVCGSPWTFALVSDEEDAKTTGPVINIIDSKIAIKNATPYLIPSTVSDSTLRDFGLDLKMTGAMKTQALYAKNPQKGRGYGDSDGEATGCTGEAIAPFYPGNVENLAKPKKGEVKVKNLGCDDAPDKESPPTLSDLVDALYYDVNDMTCGALLEGIVKKINDDVDKRHCAGVPLPFDFNFTMDGVGGFEFGQLVSSNRIPEDIRKNFRWQVTKVEHSITANDWETKVSTVARAQPK
tara:strand:- start:10062 stop:12020 length:1959 start_codon:yes stop_codon:yes gene_type:complete